jgi:hypothetical protein
MVGVVPNKTFALNATPQVGLTAHMTRRHGADRHTHGKWQILADDLVHDRPLTAPTNRRNHGGWASRF